MFNNSILMKPELIRSTYLGHKTETRRFSDKYNIGDILAIRENFCIQFHPQSPNVKLTPKEVAERYSDFTPIYQADNLLDNFQAKYKWRPSIHLPYEWVRLGIEIISKEKQKLQEITNQDIINEGIKDSSDEQLNRDNFIMLWQDINGKVKGKSWYDNPDVIVYGYKVVYVDNKLFMGFVND